MKPGTRILAISLVGLALVAVVAWGIVGPQPGARGPDLPSIAELPRAPLELHDSSDPSRSVTPIPSVDVAAGPARTGTLLVRVVDDQTGRPVANVVLRLARERGGEQLLATGTTDERGEARFDAVEANTVIVEVLRKPPYARAFGAVWLEPRETEAVVVRLDAGATVSGRVVDDLGQPIEGVDVLLGDDFAPRFGTKSWIHGSSAVSARSAADGRFTLANLARAPGGVWIEKGAMKPERWAWPTVWLRFEDAAVPTAIDPKDTAEQDLGDLVIPRAATWSGHVLDARGHPVRGALVSTIENRLQSRRGGPRSSQPELSGWPGVPSFAAWPGETLSRPDGSFELRSRFPGKRVWVITPDAARHACPVPAFEPGARFPGLELRIADATMLVIELVDASGQRIEEPTRRSHSSHRPGQRMFGGFGLQVDLRCAVRDVSVSAGSDHDGQFRIQIDGAAGPIESVRARLAGYQPVEHTLAGDPSQPLRLVLEELPVVRLRVRFAGDPQRPPESPPHIWISTCVRNPAEWRALPPEERGSAGCCGLGSSNFLPCRPGVMDLELDVAVDRPFFVHARCVSNGWASTFGPWNPGPEWHDIEIPVLEPESPAPAPSARPVPARVRARLVDARTRESLSGWIHFRGSTPESYPESMGLPSTVRISAKSAEWCNGPPGRWLAMASAKDHEPSAPIEVDLVSGTEHDLGTFALEPLPRIDVLVLTAAGEPAADATRVYFTEPQTEWGAGETLRGEAGRLVLAARLPPAGFVTVNETLAPMEWRSQIMPFAYDGGGSLTVRLAPWRRVEAQIDVQDVTEREAWIHAMLIRDPAQAAELGPFQEQLREVAADVGTRRFSTWVGPGRYTLRFNSLLMSFPDKQIELSTSGDEVVRVELRPER